MNDDPDTSSAQPAIPAISETDSLAAARDEPGGMPPLTLSGDVCGDACPAPWSGGDDDGNLRPRSDLAQNIESTHPSCRSRMMRWGSSRMAWCAKSCRPDSANVMFREIADHKLLHFRIAVTIMKCMRGG
jgi:hypothetical protein